MKAAWLSAGLSFSKLDDLIKGFNGSAFFVAALNAAAFDGECCCWGCLEILEEGATCVCGLKPCAEAGLPCLLLLTCSGLEVATDCGRFCNWCGAAIFGYCCCCCCCCGGFCLNVVLGPLVWGCWGLMVVLMLLLLLDGSCLEECLEEFVLDNAVAGKLDEDKAFNLVFSAVVNERYAAFAGFEGFDVFVGVSCRLTVELDLIFKADFLGDVELSLFDDLAGICKSWEDSFVLDLVGWELTPSNSGDSFEYKLLAAVSPDTVLAKPTEAGTVSWGPFVSILLLLTCKDGIVGRNCCAIEDAWCSCSVSLSIVEYDDWPAVTVSFDLAVEGMSVYSSKTSFSKSGGCAPSIVPSAFIVGSVETIVSLMALISVGTGETVPDGSTFALKALCSKSCSWSNVSFNFNSSFSFSSFNCSKSCVASFKWWSSSSCIRFNFGGALTFGLS